LTPVLNIRSEQMAAFLPVMERNLVAASIQCLRKQYPSLIEGLEAGVLRRRVEQCHEWAREYGIGDQPGLDAFTVLALTYGPSFHFHPEVGPALVESEEAVVDLEDRLPELVMEELAILAGGDYWDDELAGEGTDAFS